MCVNVFVWMLYAHLSVPVRLKSRSNGLLVILKYM